MLAREFDYPYFAELSNSIIWSIRQYAADSRGLITSCWMNAKGDTESEKLYGIIFQAIRQPRIFLFALLFLDNRCHFQSPKVAAGILVIVFFVVT